MKRAYADSCELRYFFYGSHRWIFSPFLINGLYSMTFREGQELLNILRKLAIYPVILFLFTHFTMFLVPAIDFMQRNPLFLTCGIVGHIFLWYDIRDGRAVLSHRRKASRLSETPASPFVAASVQILLCRPMNELRGEPNEYSIFGPV